MRRFRASSGRRRAPSLGTALTALILCIMTFPDPMLAARLELRVSGTASSDATILVGDVVDVDLWVDSESATLSGAAVFLTFDSDVFELFEQDRDPILAGFQPFATGAFFHNGEIFRNEILAADDPAASPAGEQLDYSVVRATDSGSGPTASFRLRALAPAAGSAVRIDESGIRETRYFTPDGSHEAFRFITPLTVTVRGIGIEGLPQQLVLARGQVDSSSFHLDDFLFDPVYGPEEIEWHVEAPAALSAQLDTESRRLIVSAPGDRSLWEQLTLSAINPDGQSAVAVVEVFVNASPDVPAALEPIGLQEDDTFRLSLDDIVVDPDAPDAQLQWSLEAEAELGARIDGPPYELALEPAPDWSGTGQVRLRVSDGFGFSDSVAVDVSVAAVNDAPVTLYSPNLRVTRGKVDSSLVLSDLFEDAEEATTDLAVSWTGADRIDLEAHDGRLHVTAPAAWQGSETIEVTVEDGGGLRATAILTVTVVPSLAPSIDGAPRRLGMAAGADSVLDLSTFVTDPDDPAGDLVWSVDGHSALGVQLSSAGAVRIEAPASFAGTEVVRFTATDPSGESASFELLVFAAPAGGEPLVAAIPDLALPPAGVNASVDLDDYLFDIDHDPELMTWSVIGPVGLDVRVDPASHVLTIVAADSVSGVFDIDVRVIDPDGHEATGRLRVTVQAGDSGPVDVEPKTGIDPQPPVSLTLLPLPTLRLTAGGFDQSLVIDDYVASGDPAGLIWEALAGEHTQVLVDPATRVITILAAPDWTGPELITIRALDGSGRIVAETVMGVQITAPAPPLELADLVEVPVLAGDSTVVFEVTQMLSGSVDPASLSWEATGTRSYGLSYDAGSGCLQLVGEGFAVSGAEVVTITARDNAGNLATGRVLVQVLPVDGSAGETREGFSVTVVPNPIQPDYLDLFVLTDDDRYAPRLRTGGSSPWRDLSLTSIAEGIWHATDALTPGMEGPVDFLALALEGQRLTSSRRQIFVGTAPAAAGKTIAAADFQLDVAAGDFGAEAVVAVIPGAIDHVPEELVPIGSAFDVHATRPLTSSPSLSLRTPAGVDAAVYRWDGLDQRWRFVGGDRDGDRVQVALPRLGRYALFVDTVAPRIDGDTEDFRVLDGGSGVAGVELLADGLPVDGGVSFDGEWAHLTGIAPAHASLVLRATDRAGNASRLAVTVADPLPLAFELGQNFPNPFNPETTIPVRVAAGGQPVRLEVFNSAGQRVRLLVDEVLPAGSHSFHWDALDDRGQPVASGAYLYRAVVGSTAHSRRMTLLR